MSSNELKRNETELTGIIGVEKIDHLESIKDSIKWRDYRKKYRQAANLEKILEHPIQIDFELNATCNLKCPMCPLSTEINSEKKKYLFPFELFCKIIDIG
ncbi:radical SAM protein, partial [Campylobacter jejuni]